MESQPQNSEIWKVSLKILNSGFILKTFTHVLSNDLIRLINNKLHAQLADKTCQLFLRYSPEASTTRDKASRVPEDINSLMSIEKQIRQELICFL